MKNLQCQVLGVLHTYIAQNRVLVVEDLWIDVLLRTHMKFGFEKIRTEKQSPPGAFRPPFRDCEKKT